MRKLIIGLACVGLLSGCQRTNIPTTTTQQLGSKSLTGEQLPVEENLTQEAKITQQSQVIQSFSYNVVKVVDGDTVDVTINGQTERVRLIGIDTPETVDPRKSVQCFGIEASNKAKEILTGQKVYLEADETQGEHDKYNRLLRYVFLEDGTNFNEMMISEGYAHEYTYNLPYEYQTDFKAAEKQAIELKKGLWADNACIVEAETLPVIKPSAPSRVNTFSCSISKNCSQMASCEEAYFYVNTCGKTSLDRDKDGVPCEIICN